MLTDVGILAPVNAVVWTATWLFTAGGASGAYDQDYRKNWKVSPFSSKAADEAGQAKDAKDHELVKTAIDEFKHAAEVLKCKGDWRPTSNAMGTFGVPQNQPAMEVADKLRSALMAVDNAAVLCHWFDEMADIDGEKDGIYVIYELVEAPYGSGVWCGAQSEAAAAAALGPKKLSAKELQTLNFRM
jgi:hypothetical protein